MQTMRRTSTAKICRKWNNKYPENLQESSPEVSSSDTFSSRFQADSGAAAREEVQEVLWNLDPDVRAQPDTNHYHTITNNPELIISDPTSPFPDSIQGKFN